MRNAYEVRGDTTAIFVKRKSETLEVLIDTDDLPRVSGVWGTWSWLYSKRTKGYAWYQPWKEEGGCGVLLHRFITDAPIGMLIDHEDTNVLNNRKSNLRIATGTQNNANANLRVDNQSRYKGVDWRLDKACWRARIGIAGKSVHVGHFGSAEEAAKAYDDAALTHFGPFARLNFPQEAQVAA